MLFLSIKKIYLQKDQNSLNYILSIAACLIHVHYLLKFKKRNELKLRY